ncbi:MAG: Uma2 family endonuclease [Ktedonobacteraceae bacterium]|nr:Uma2 family endonuclease [Ktedonobacteraceae bacterium]
MAKRLEDDEIVYYYDRYPTEEDLMGETIDHSTLVQYLMQVLTWLFEGQACVVHANLNFYQTPYWKEYPLVPDLAVIKGMEFRRMRSWRVGKTGPAPHVVVEIASEETWDKDLTEKPSKYAAMGVEEYFAYDPNEPPLRRGGRRLFGWRLERASRMMHELPLEPDGRLWSRHLESYLVADSAYLRLYDRTGHLRLTRAEAEAEARWAETRRAEAEAKARRAETRRADAEARRADVLAEKLRSLGIDPDQL